MVDQGAFAEPHQGRQMGLHQEAGKHLELKEQTGDHLVGAERIVIHEPGHGVEVRAGGQKPAQADQHERKGLGQMMMGRPAPGHRPGTANGDPDAHGPDQLSDGEGSDDQGRIDRSGGHEGRELCQQTGQIGQQRLVKALGVHHQGFHGCAQGGHQAPAQ